MAPLIAIVQPQAMETATKQTLELAIKDATSANTVHYAWCKQVYLA